MEFKLTINCDNAAFNDDMASELALILHGTAKRVANGETCPLRLGDSNGNTVGSATVTKD